MRKASLAYRGELSAALLLPLPVPEPPPSAPGASRCSCPTGLDTLALALVASTVASPGGEFNSITRAQRLRCTAHRLIIRLRSLQACGPRVSGVRTPQAVSFYREVWINAKPAIKRSDVTTI